MHSKVKYQWFVALLLINSDNQEMEIAIISPGKTICMRKKTYCMRKKSSGAEKVKTLSVSYFYWVMQGLGGSYGGSRGRSQSRLQSIKDCVKLSAEGAVWKALLRMPRIIGRKGVGRCRASSCPELKFICWFLSYRKTGNWMILWNATESSYLRAS